MDHLDSISEINQLVIRQFSRVTISAIHEWIKNDMVFIKLRPIFTLLG